MSTKAITIDDKKLQAALMRLQKSASDITPVMRKLAGMMAAETEQNFADEGRPKWQPLSDATKRARIGGSKAYGKNGKMKASAQRQVDSGFRILQHTGGLAASISTDYSSMEAVIGSNKVYAAIQHFGGDAGRGRSVEIPARPYLPLTADDQLPSEVQDAMLDSIIDHLKSAAGI